VHRSGEIRSLAGSRERDRHSVWARREQLPAGRGQRGSSRLKAVMFLALAVAVIYVGVKVIPILVNAFQFQDALDSTARFASVNRQTPEDIRVAVLKEAQNEDIPIAAQDIHVKGENGHVEINADYSVTINLGVYQWTLNFHPYAKNNPIL
jgi:Domain of unknown function (DUF4845)